MKFKDKTKNWVKSLDVPDSVSFCVGDQVVVTANVDQDIAYASEPSAAASKIANLNKD